MEEDLEETAHHLITVVLVVKLMLISRFVITGAEFLAPMVKHLVEEMVVTVFTMQQAVVVAVDILEVEAVLVPAGVLAKAEVEVEAAPVFCIPIGNY